MHVTLIKPKIGDMARGPYIDEGRMEPLQLAVLAGLCPGDVEVSLYDDRFEAVPYERPTDLVAITVETFTARRSYEIAALYRARGVPVLMGGMHPTLFPEEVRQHADSLVTGDAEGVWARVIADARQGKLQPLYRSDAVLPGPDRLPDRTLLRDKGYLPITLMQFSRGCPFSCIYCATSTYFGAKHYCRPVEAVLREIEAQERRVIFFVDDNITANRAEAKKLFKALIPLKVLWVGQASVDITEDRELVGLMARSGCLGFVAGFESLSPASLRWMHKGQNMHSFDRYHHQIRMLQDHGFQLWAAFTLGHDYDTVTSIEDTIAFALKYKFTFAAFNILLPYPRTPLYERLEREGRLLYDGHWWLHPAYRFNQAAFQPKNMSPEKLTELGIRARQEFNSFGSILRRAFNLKTNMRSLLRLAIYLKYSRLFRKEVHKKEGMFFGVGGKRV